MAATILDGTRIASDIRAEVAAETRALADAGMRPGLAVVLVGHNPASEIYVRGKVKSSEEVGLYSEKHTPPSRSSATSRVAPFPTSTGPPRTSTNSRPSRPRW